MKKEEIGHHFLARLGKTHLRPGGKRATDWLISQGNFSKNKQVLNRLRDTIQIKVKPLTQNG